MTQEEKRDMMKNGANVTFIVRPTKNKEFTREYWCKDFDCAMSLQSGMMYALFTEYKHPTSEMWVDGKMIHSMR